MTLPDFMDYKDKFTQRAFVEKISLPVPRWFIQRSFSIIR